MCQIAHRISNRMAAMRAVLINVPLQGKRDDEVIRETQACHSRRKRATGAGPGGLGLEENATDAPSRELGREPSCPTYAARILMSLGIVDACCVVWSGVPNVQQSREDRSSRAGPGPVPAFWWVGGVGTASRAKTRLGARRKKQALRSSSSSSSSRGKAVRQLRRQGVTTHCPTTSSGDTRWCSFCLFTFSTQGDQARSLPEEAELVRAQIPQRGMHLSSHGQSTSEQSAWSGSGGQWRKSAGVWFVWSL